MSGALETARAHWGEDLPDWVERLAKECAASSQRRVADRLGRSAGLISHVLRNNYPGDTEAVEEAVRGAFMNAEVACPALGTIPADECQSWRRKSRRFVNVNSLRVRMFRACANCPRNRKES